MKKTGILLVAFALLVVCFSGVACNNGALDSLRGVWFEAEVIEVYDGSILVSPVSDSDEAMSANLISVKTTDVKDLPNIEKGDIVRIKHSGEVAESYPAQIFKVYKIELVE